MTGLVTIYALVDPRDGATRYIGQTSNPRGRISAHRCALKYRHHNSPTHAWLRELMGQGLQPIFRVLADVAPSEAAAEEGAQIRAHIERGCALTNRKANYRHGRVRTVSTGVDATVYDALAAEARARGGRLAWLARTILEQHVAARAQESEGVA